MTFTPIEVIVSLATIAMLVLNLTLRGGLTNLKLAFERDLNGVQLQLANLRTEIARDQVSLMAKIGDSFLPRTEAEAMHEVNVERLKGIQTEVRALAVRVGDIS